jgi:hypothetical protein
MFRLLSGFLEGRTEWGKMNREGLTEKARQVLCAVGVDSALVLAVGLVPELVHLVVLRALEAVRSPLVNEENLAEKRQGILPVQQNAAEALVKVLPQASHRLLQNVQRGTALRAVRLLVSEVVVQDLVDRVGVRERNELLVFGDILPVVDEQRLDVIRHRQLDGRAVVEVVLLLHVSDFWSAKFSDFCVGKVKKTIRHLGSLGL